jgi:NAD(P)-dependent dehydrogenase (short-subunit alcohol dehydrogenase family)
MMRFTNPAELGGNKIQQASLLDIVAVITGPSPGIGAAVAQELASWGAKVVLNCPIASLKQQAEKID